MPMHKSVRGLLLAVFTLALLAAGSAHGAPSGDIIYVKHDATGSNNGSSWNDAYTDLQDALGVAQPGDEVWVADGVYYPAANALDRTATFELKDDIAVYGGFAGTETERAQRDWETNVTVLSGDLDRNDTTDDNRVVTDTLAIVGRNAYHVVTVGVAGCRSLIDGFTVTAGLANARTEEYGGGIFKETGSLELFHVTLSGNFALSSGGGLYDLQGSSALTGVTFSGNRAEQRGGGSIHLKASPTLSDVVFTRNRASRGGGLYSYFSTPTLSEASFVNNTATDGGGVYNRSSDLILDQGFFTDNQAENGAGIYSYDGRPTIADVHFVSNVASYDGGGIYIEYGFPVISRTTLGENVADNGAGMASRYARPTLTNVHFTANQADRDGGGIWSQDRDLKLINVRFLGNQAVDAGGGAHLTDSTCVMTNTLFAVNRANYGGGTYNQAGDVTLVNATIADNTAGSQGGAIHNVSSSPVLANCIVWGNMVPGDASQIHNDEASAPYVMYSDIQGGYSGPGNIEVDPLFVSPGTDALSLPDFGDYHLIEGSPVIDLGTNDVVATAIDLDGNPRIVDGTGDGNAVVDMGAYELQVPSLIVTKQGQGLVTSTPTGIDCGSACAAGFLPGTDVTLTATADTGWTFDHWSGACTGTGTCQVTMDDDKSVTAHFTQEEYTLDVNIVGEGIVGIEPEQAVYHYGDVVTLTATPDLGWTFDGWTGDQLSNDNPLALTIEGDTVITATFTRDEYSLDVTIVGQGDVGVEPDQDVYHYGDVVTLTATADPGWTFTGWSGDIISTDNPLELTIQDSTVTTATFTQDEYILDVSIVGDGDVEVDPDQDTYHYGDVVTLTATADAGWSFAGWSGDIESTDNPLALTIQDDADLTATFTQDEYTLGVAIVGEGEVDINPEQDTYVYGDVVTLTATAGPGWSFASWSGDVESTDNPLDFVVEGDTVITATFTEEYKKVYLPLVLANH